MVVANLREVESGAFSNCLNLQLIDLTRCERIGFQAFKNCFSLQPQVLGARSIEGLAFENCISMRSARATQLERCAIDAFLNCDVQLETNYAGKLVDVQRVRLGDFPTQREFLLNSKQPQNWLMG